MILAALPISELRGAIPVAIGVYGLSPIEAYVLAVAGNLIPVVPLLLFLEPISVYLRRFPTWDRFFTWLFTRTYRKYVREHEEMSLLGLAIFVGIPLPVTGAWTGCAIAFLLGFPFWKAFPAIAAGVLMAGAIITAMVVGVQFLLV